jgi:hypothetical protein
MHTIQRRLALLGLLAAFGCSDLTVPDFNNSGLDDLRNNPTRSKVIQASQGLLVGTRLMMGAQNAYVSLLGILGRESYNFDPADPRFITEMLIGPLDGGSPAFGGNLFAQPYRNIRNANTLLGALDAVAGVTDEEKEAIRGFAKTIMALDYLLVLNTRDNLGAPIDVSGDPTGEPAPIASKDAVLARVAQLLDEGQAHLQAGGSAFPFSLGAGFTGFNTPATFLQVNRAIKARADVYTATAVPGAPVVARYTDALQALAGSFVSTGASLDLGVYHAYSTASGDLQNELFDPTGRAILAHPALTTDAQLQPGGARDARYLRKVAPLGEVKTVQNISTDVLFQIYTSNEAPIPIIRNEELLLLRAEARWFTGDKPGAMADLNFVRQTSGGLAPIAQPATDAAFIDALLYERRYSLMFEGGHRWIDTRRLNRQTLLPLALASHTRQPRFPFPEAECLARVPAPAECP